MKLPNIYTSSTCFTISCNLVLFYIGRLYYVGDGVNFIHKVCQNPSRCLDWSDSFSYSINTKNGCEEFEMESFLPFFHEKDYLKNQIQHNPPQNNHVCIFDGKESK